MECICYKINNFAIQTKPRLLRPPLTNGGDIFQSLSVLVVKNQLLKVSKHYFSFCPLYAHVNVICLPPAEGVPVTAAKLVF